MRNKLIEIGRIIRKRRELLGLLQPQLSSIAGVSRRTIQLVEMGNANPSVGTLIKIADPLGLTIKLLLKELSENEQIP
jgi:transcriptional regulator with XRE-family HTH domain